MDVRIEREGNVIVLACHGAIELRSGPELRAQFGTLLRPRLTQDG